jgi:hypothetical protein
MQRVCSAGVALKTMMTIIPEACLNVSELILHMFSAVIYTPLTSALQ